MRRLGRVASHVVPAAYEVPAVPDDERQLFAGTGAALQSDVVDGLELVSSAAAIAAFRSSGFLVVEEAFSAQQVADALAGITAIARRENVGFVHRMENPHAEVETRGKISSNAPLDWSFRRGWL